jgi:hypothetical protein
VRSLELNEEFIQLDLTEGKSFADIKKTGVIRQRIIDNGYDFDKEAFSTARRQATKVANKEFDALQSRVSSTLKSLVDRYYRGDINYGNLSFGVREALRSSYRRAFEIGLRSSGSGVFHSPTSKGETTYYDREYIDSAYREEMRYMNKLLGQIRTDSVRGNVYTRIDAYAQTLRHQMLAGRVVASPSSVIVDWVAPLDRKTCKSCRWLSQHSPYTKDSLPTTPRGGSTLCLHKCRCKLVLRQVSPQVVADVRRSHYQKGYYKSKLEAIKAGKLLI